MEHRSVRYEIKMAVGRNQWTWIVHTTPKPKQGSVDGPRREARICTANTVATCHFIRAATNGCKWAAAAQMSRNQAPTQSTAQST